MCPLNKKGDQSGKPKSMRKIRCGQCGQSIFKHLWFKHLQSHKSEKKCLCPFCGHQHILQPKNEPYATGDDVKCDVLDLTFEYDDSYLIENQPHWSEPHECQICGQTLGNRNGLRNHLVIHWFRCSVCKPALLFNSKEDLANHNKEKHNEESNPNSGSQVSDLNVPKPDNGNDAEEFVLCFKCNKFVRKKEFQCHAIYCYRCFKCPKCRRYFMLEERMRSHLRNDHSDWDENFQCKICRGIFKTVLELDGHYKEFHREILFHCRECGGSFRNFDEWEYHSSKPKNCGKVNNNFNGEGDIFKWVSHPEVEATEQEDNLLEEIFRVSVNFEELFATPGGEEVVDVDLDAGAFNPIYFENYSDFLALNSRASSTATFRLNNNENDAQCRRCPFCRRFFANDELLSAHKEQEHPHLL